MSHKQPDHPEKSKWKRIEPTIVSTVGQRTVVSKMFMLPGGAIHNIDTFWPEGSVYVTNLALTPDNKVIVGRQFRPGPERMMDELPGGLVRTGETLEKAARRELLSEAGYMPGSLEYLGPAGRDGYTNALWHYFLATDCTPVDGAQQMEAAERIEVMCISIDDLIANARSYRMTDPAGVLLAYEKLMKLKGVSV